MGFRQLLPKRLGSLAAVAWLAACGGGGGQGGGGTPPPADPPAMVAGLHCSGPASSGWCWQAPQPWGHHVHDLRFTSAADGWAVGDGGLLLRTRDGGRSWSERVLPGLPPLLALDFADARTGWLLGRDEGRIWRTDDGGETWVALPRLPFDRAHRLRRAGSQTLVVTGSMAGTWYSPGTVVSDDGGRSWRASARTVDVVESGGALWSRDDTAGVLQSVDGGRSFGAPQGWTGDWRVAWWDVDSQGSAWVMPWRQIPVELQLSGVLWRPDSGAGWSAAPSAPIADQPLSDLTLFPRGGWARTYGSTALDDRWWRWDGPGSDWAPVSMPDALTAVSITGHGFVDDSGWWFQAYAPRGRFVYLTLDGGRNWLADIGQPAGTSDAVRFLRRDSGGGLLLAYGGYEAGHDAGYPWTPVERWYRSPDAGRSWLPVPGGLPPDDPVAGLQLFDDERGMGLTANGVLLTTRDGGRHWQREPTRLQNAEALQFTPDGSGWVLEFGRVRRTRDGGRSWDELPLPEALQRGVARLQWVDDRNGFATVNFSCGRHSCLWRLYASADGGISWQERPDAQGHAGHVHMLDATRGVRFAFDQVWRTEDGARSWVAAAVDGGTSMLPQRVIALADGTLLALDASRLLRSEDGGRVWREVALPLGTALDTQFLSTTSGLRDIAFADARNGWIVGDDGYVLASGDGGRSWARQASGSQQHLRVVVARPGGRVWAGGAYGTVLATASGGR